MSNDEKIQELNKRIDVSLHYYDNKSNSKKIPKVNKTKLKDLAHHIRKSLEEYPVEASIHPNSSR